MARARNIKPAFFKNELLGTEDPILSLLFISLWTLADRKGRLEDRPLRIKAETFPYRELSDFNGYLTKLEQLGFIERYKVGEIAVIQILNFIKHQTPHNTEKDSELPENPHQTKVTVNVPLNNGDLTEAKRSDSLLLNHESLNTQAAEEKNISEVIHRPEPTQAASVCLAVKNHGILDVNPTNPKLLALLEAGATVEEFNNAASVSKVKKFAYILGTVEGMRKEASELTLVRGSIKPKESAAWRNDDTLIMKKAKEFGISTTGKSRFEILAKIDAKREGAPG